MTAKVDEAIVAISDFITEHKECSKELTELKDQLTDSNSKMKHEVERRIAKRIEAVTKDSLEKQRKWESESMQKLKQTEEAYINKIRGYIQKNIEIREENEQLKAKLKMHHNETLQITNLEQHNNSLTERIALIEKCLDESARKAKISDDRITSLENQNQILESEKILSDDRIKSLENQNQILESEKILSDDRIKSLESEKILSDDRIASLENQNKILESEKILLEVRITRLENQNKILESEKILSDDRITSLENQIKISLSEHKV